jgi:hypothetical protein
LDSEVNTFEIIFFATFNTSSSSTEVLGVRDTTEPSSDDALLLVLGDFGGVLPPGATAALAALAAEGTFTTESEIDFTDSADIWRDNESGCCGPVDAAAPPAA